MDELHTELDIHKVQITQLLSVTQTIAVPLVEDV